MILDNDGETSSADFSTGRVIMDIGRSSGTLSRGKHSHAILTVPRDLALSGLTHDPFGNYPAISVAEARGLAPLLAADLQMFGLQAGQLNAYEPDLAIRQTAELALSCPHVGSDAIDPGTSRASKAAFPAACAHIDRHLANPGLTVDAIALSRGFFCERIWTAYLQAMAKPLPRSCGSAGWRAHAISLPRDTSGSSMQAPLRRAIKQPPPSDVPSKNHIGASLREYRALGAGGLTLCIVVRSEQRRQDGSASRRG